MKINYKHITTLILGFGFLVSCSEEDLKPSTPQTKDIKSIETVSDINNVLNGAYDNLSTVSYYGRDIIILGEIFSDNCVSIGSSNRFVEESAMDLLASNAIAEGLWAQAYDVIAQANIVINTESVSGDQAQFDYYKGQAYALRALAHYDLLKFFGQQNVNGAGGMASLGVPYVTTFADPNNLSPTRKTVQEVLDLIYADLDMAESLMDPSLNVASKEYISTYAVDAIRARVATYFEDWSIALQYAGEIVNSGAFQIASVGQFLNTFSTDNTANSIFEIGYTDIDNPNIDGLYNIYQGVSYGDIVVLPNLEAIYDDNDIRGLGGIISPGAGAYFRNTGKYPSPSFDDNVSVFRYEEMVLVYAEALLETGSPAAALVQLNKIPANRNAQTYTTATKANILLERRKELAFEGFRFHDLARTGQDIPEPDPVLQTHNGPDYGSYNFALPIPAAEINANGNVVQNQGF